MTTHLQVENSASETANEARSSNRAPCARDKIVDLPTMVALAADARAVGQRVVLAHGVFDLLHMGHVRHLEEAHRQGDLLLLTLTADAHVNKGPGRPVFPQMLRAEMAAAMACIDLVAISHTASAEAVINQVKPDVYVKGPDYADANDDVTGKINSERQAVEAYGGRIHFTEDITFSSSSLINRHLNVYEPEVAEFLANLRAQGALTPILDAFNAIAGSRVLLIGEAIVDEYDYCAPMGKSAKESIIATKYQDREVFAGGVIAAANHVADFVQQVDVIAAIGADESYEQLIRDSVGENVNLHFLRRPGKPTTRKVRFVEPGHLRKMFEVYHFDDAPLDAREEGELTALIAAHTAASDVVIVNDFGHGMMTPHVIDVVTQQARFLAVNAQTNSANIGFNPVTKYRRADYLCVDAPEARFAVHDRVIDMQSLIAGPLRRQIDCDRIIVTHGQNGCYAFDADSGVHHIPAFTRQVVDTVGAGDAFLSVTAPLVEAGQAIDRVAVIGNAVGAMKVGIVGHRSSVARIPTVKFLTALLK